MKSLLKNAAAALFASLLLIVPAIAEEAETKTSKPSLTYYFYDG